MADELKTTLYWTADPNESFTDVSGTGGQVVVGINAAGSSDGNDATYAEFETTGDGSGTNGELDWFVTENGSGMTSCSYHGAVSFVRVSARARHVGNGASANIRPTINGTMYGAQTSVSGSAATYTWDFSTNPDAGNAAWLSGSINSATWGVGGTLYFDDAHSPAAGQLRLIEFQVQVWGPQVAAQTSTPSAVGVNLNALDCSRTPGPVSVAVATAGQTISAASPSVTGGDANFYNDSTDPTSLVPVVTYIDNQFVPTVKFRSDTAPFNNDSDATAQVLSSPVLGTPSTGALTFNLGGISAGSGAINGEGDIYGIKCYARVRAGTDALTAFDSFVFEVHGDTYAVVAAPPIYTLSDLGEPFVTVSSSVIGVTSTNVPFTWGSGANSVSVQLSGWKFIANYTVAAGYQAQCKVSEAWVEIIRKAGPTVAGDVLFEQRITASGISITTTSSQGV